MEMFKTSLIITMKESKQAGAELCQAQDNLEVTDEVADRIGVEILI